MYMLSDFWQRAPKISRPASGIIEIDKSVCEISMIKLCSRRERVVWQYHNSSFCFYLKQEVFRLPIKKYAPQSIFFKTNCHTLMFLLKYLWWVCYWQRGLLLYSFSRMYENFSVNWALLLLGKPTLWMNVIFSTFMIYSTMKGLFEYQNVLENSVYNETCIYASNIDLRSYVRQVN